MRTGRRTGLVTVLAASLLALALPASAARAADPACTAAEAGTGPPPIGLSDPTAPGDASDVTRGPLAAGHVYRVYTTRSGGANDWQIKDGSVRVSAPADVPLTDVGQTPGLVFSFTPPRAGVVLHLTVTWQLSGPIYPYPTCTATGAVDIAVTSAGFASVVGARFIPALFRLNSHTLEVIRPVDSLTLTVRGGRSPIETANVTILVRVRAGRARAPAARGRASLRFVLMPRPDGGFNGAGFRNIDVGESIGAVRSNVVLTELSNRRGVAVNLYPGGGLTSSRTLRFGVSIEVRQGTRSLGGLRSGLICRLRRKTFHLRHLLVPRRGVKCAHPGFARRP